MKKIVLSTVIAALAIPAAASAQVNQHDAVSRTQHYMSLNCGEGFAWACVNDNYLSPVCRDSKGHSAWMCTGAVREGTPNRINVVTVRIRKRDGDILIRNHPSERLGSDIVL